MEQTYIFGVDYVHADLAIREKFAFSTEEIKRTIMRLQNAGISREIIILSTCNRTEVYCTTTDVDFVINAICDIKSVCPRTLKKHCYLHSGIDCARHLFAVVSGLESMVLGETEIMAQTREALRIAQEANSAGVYLSGLFQQAFATAKEVRSRTAISTASTSMGRAVLNIVSDHLEQLEQNSHLPEPNLIFIGAGMMMQQIIPYFADSNKFTHKIIVNRTVANALPLAEQISAEVLPLTQLADIINESSVIIACCSSDAPLIKASLWQQSSRKAAASTISTSQAQPQLIIDLSLPLVTDHTLLMHKHMRVLTVDDLAAVVDIGIAQRQQASEKAQEIIEEQIYKYKQWLNKLGLSPIIKALRQQAETIKLEAVAQAKLQLLNGANADNVLDELANKLTNKLLHAPTVNLYANSVNVDTNAHNDAAAANDNLIKLVCQLYSLNFRNSSDVSGKI